MVRKKYESELIHYFHEKLSIKLLADPLQKEFVEAIAAPTDEIEAVFSDSIAGTGKTFLALTTANWMLERGLFSKIIYIRNAVSVKEQGFLPGTIEEKESVYMRPCSDVFDKLGQDLFMRLLEQDKLEITTTSYLRGVDYEGDICIILDEAQNLNLMEMKTVLTRPHSSVKKIIIGSSLQNDETYPKYYGKGLLPFQLFIKHYEEAEHLNIKNITLKTNYRGQFSLYADEIEKTIDRLKEEDTND